MKKTLCLLATFLAIHASAQYNWKVLNPLPSYHRGKDIHFVSADIGYIINDYELLETLNAGGLWTKKQNILSGNDISFKGTTGFIVGNSGYILKSTDSGATWSVIDIDNNGHFNAVTILDDNNIYISSDNEIVKSTDGGLNWQTFSVTQGTITKSFFTSTQVGHAVCTGGKILKTIDGGLTWTIKESTNIIPSDFLSLHFVNENLGFAGREHNYIYKTTDGGETWNETDSEDAMYSIHFPSQNTGYAVGNYGVVKKTTNGGNTWSTLYTTPPYQAASEMFGTYFTSNTVGYAAGTRGRIMKTTNGGSTWTPYASIYSTITQLSFTNIPTAYMMVGNQFYKSVDAAESWQLQYTFPNSIIPREFQFVNETTAYALAGDKIYKTTNSGQAWNATNNNAPVDYMNNPVCLHFIDENTGFASSYNSLYKTSNGGNSWEKIADYFFGQIEFINSQTGYARNMNYADGRMYKTTDGGTTWTIIYEIDDDIKSFDFVDENTGYFVGDSGVAYKTEDGGETWNQLEIAYNYYTEVKFSDALHGYAATDYGYLYYTQNGGDTWNLVTIIGEITCIVPHEGNVYLTGSYGKILRTGNNILSTDNIVNEEDLSSSIKLYPNPTDNIVNITSTKIITEVEVMDMSGRIIKNLSPKYSGQEIEVDLINYPAGLYFLNIYFENNSFVTKKLILK